MSPTGRTDLTERFKRKKNKETNESRYLDIQKRTEEQTNEKVEEQKDIPLEEQNVPSINNQEIERTNIQQSEWSNIEEIRKLSEQVEQINERLKYLILENKEKIDELKPDTIRRSFDLTKQMAKRLKLEAALSNRYMNDIVLEALELWFKEKGKVPEQLLTLLGDEHEGTET